MPSCTKINLCSDTWYTSAHRSPHSAHTVLSYYNLTFSAQQRLKKKKKIQTTAPQEKTQIRISSRAQHPRARERRRSTRYYVAACVRARRETLTVVAAGQTSERGRAREMEGAEEREKYAPAWEPRAHRDVTDRQVVSPRSGGKLYSDYLGAAAAAAAVSSELLTAVAAAGRRCGRRASAVLPTEGLSSQQYRSRCWCISARVKSRRERGGGGAVAN